MEIKLKNVLNYNTVFKNIIDNSNVSGQLKFRFLTALKQFEPVVANFNQIKDDFIVKYGSVQPDGGYAIIEPDKQNFENDTEYETALNTYVENFKAFTDEINKLLEELVEINFTKFDVSIMDANIPSDALLLIYDLIEV